MCALCIYSITTMIETSDFQAVASPGVQFTDLLHDMEADYECQKEDLHKSTELFKFYMIILKFMKHLNQIKGQKDLGQF